MFKTLSAIALAGSTLLGFASSAVAGYGMQPWDAQGAANLIRVAESHGIEVHADHELCRSNRNIYGLMSNKNEMYLCGDNIPNVDMLGEVIRHELVHAAQFCRWRRGKPMLVEPDKFDGFEQYAAVALDFVGQNYPPEQFEVEVEARVMGNVYSNTQVANILDKECGL